VQRFQCAQCGYVSRGRAAPPACPVCGAPAGDFEPLTSALIAFLHFPQAGWWLIHVVGIAVVFALGVLSRGVVRL
jgi:hypothetical protein